MDSLEERHLLYRYLSSGHVRLVSMYFPWAEDLTSAGRYLDWAERARLPKE